MTIGSFNSKKWITENKYGIINEQTGSATGSASTGSASTGSASTGSASTGSVSYKPKPLKKRRLKKGLKEAKYIIKNIISERLVNEDPGDAACTDYLSQFPDTDVEAICCPKCLQSQDSWGNCAEFCELECCRCDQHSLESEIGVEETIEFCTKCWSGYYQNGVFDDDQCECCDPLPLRWVCTDTATDYVGWDADFVGMGDGWEIGGTCVSAPNPNFPYSSQEECEAGCSPEDETDIFTGNISYSGGPVKPNTGGSVGTTFVGNKKTPVKPNRRKR